MIKNLTKLGCHLVCRTYYLKIAHYLPHLIFSELTSLCGNWSNDQRTHLFGILSCVGVLMAGVAFLPFLFVMNHHLAAAREEARLEVTSVISVTIVPSVTLTTGSRVPGSRRQHEAPLPSLPLPAGSHHTYAPPLPRMRHLLLMFTCCPGVSTPCPQCKDIQPLSHLHASLAGAALLKHSSD